MVAMEGEDSTMEMDSEVVPVLMVGEEELENSVSVVSSVSTPASKITGIGYCFTRFYFNYLSPGFHDDETNNTFGYYKKGVYMPQSNFLFEFVAEVVCESFPQSSGFLINVKAEGSASSW